MNQPPFAAPASIGLRGVCIGIFGILATLAGASPAAAQQVVNSEKVEAVSVTLYRDPRPSTQPQPPAWPSGYALITETRTIRVPAGRAVIRFQGVSQGMLPETAIVSGLPRQVNEKNRDALLLSPAGLVDAWLKRRVILRRTDPATGKAKAEPAVIEAGPTGGVVLTTADGVEALSCAGLPESLRYPGVPDGLFARPTLSVVTENPVAVTAKVQLFYLAEGFDWSANYVARVADDGDTIDLFAWLTIRNGGSEGFGNANTQAVAGRLDKLPPAEQPQSPDPRLRLDCWPLDVTSSHPAWTIEALPLPSAPADLYGRNDSYYPAEPTPPPLSMPMPMMALAAPAPPALVADQEDLGDLKLYRIPEPVTIAAQSTKQVAMIDRRKIKVKRIWSASVIDDSVGTRPANIILRAQNLESDGLGLPLPAGDVASFRQQGGRTLLVAEGRMTDRAIGDELEVNAGTSNDVRYEITALERTMFRMPFLARVTNARSTAVTFELTFETEVVDIGDNVGTRKGRRVWQVTVPPNGAAQLTFAYRTAR